jgi:hypothetical protein
LRPRIAGRRATATADAGARQNGHKLNSGQTPGIMAGRFSLSAFKAQETNTWPL